MPSASCAALASLGWVTAYDATAARLAGVGVCRYARTSAASSPAPQAGTAHQHRIASLHQRSGVVFAKQLRVLLSQGPHQLEMQVVDHARAGLEEALVKGRA